MPDSLERESMGSNPLCCCFEDSPFSFSPLTPQFTQLYKWGHGYRQQCKCEWIVFVWYVTWLNASQRSRVCFEMNRSARVWSVKHFAWSNRLDTSLYTTVPFYTLGVFPVPVFWSIVVRLVPFFSKCSVMLHLLLRCGAIIHMSWVRDLWHNCESVRRAM